MVIAEEIDPFARIIQNPDVDDPMRIAHVICFVNTVDTKVAHDTVFNLHVTTSIHINAMGGV